jgi:hypothetical protein
MRRYRATTTASYLVASLCRQLFCKNLVVMHSLPHSPHVCQERVFELCALQPASGANCSATYIMKVMRHEKKSRTMNKRNISGFSGGTRLCALPSHTLPLTGLLPAPSQQHMSCPTMIAASHQQRTSSGRRGQKPGSVSR